MKLSHKVLLITIGLIFCFSAMLYSLDVKFIWSKSDGAVKYNIYQTSTHGKYDKSKDKIATVEETSYDLAVPNDHFLFWVVTAIDENGNESEYSREINNIGWVLTCLIFKKNC